MKSIYDEMSLSDRVVIFRFLRYIIMEPLNDALRKMGFGQYHYNPEEASDELFEETRLDKSGVVIIKEERDDI